MMKDKTEFWLHLFMSAVLPYLLGGGGVYLLVQFREQLPERLYTTFLYIIYAVLVIVLIRFAFGNWLSKFYTYIRKQLRHRARKKAVQEWYQKWRGLCQLMKKVIETDWQPTKEQEGAYSKLRFWFRTNRSKFLPVWHSFEASRTRTAGEHTYSSQASLAYHVFVNNYGDPFSYFYDPFDLKELDHILIYHKADVGNVLIKLLELTDECVEWVSLKR